MSDLFQELMGTACICGGRKRAKDEKAAQSA